MAGLVASVLVACLCAASFVSFAWLLMRAPLPGGAWWPAFAVDLVLLLLFALPHSLLARASFSSWWRRRLPAALERTVYVLQSSLLLLLLVHAWQPLPGFLWHLQGVVGRALLHGLGVLGLGLAIGAVLQTGGLELVGLRQAWAAARGRPYTEGRFREDLLFAFVRHPMTLGTILALWGTPRMTWDRAILASALTLYALAAIHFEERDAKGRLGEVYEAYRSRVPMLLPRVIAPARPSASSRAPGPGDGEPPAPGP